MTTRDLSTEGAVAGQQRIEVGALDRTLHSVALEQPVYDAQKAHRLVWRMAGERALWSQVNPRVLLVQANEVKPRRLGRVTSTVSMGTHHAGDVVDVALVASPCKSVTEAGRSHSTRRPLPEGAWPEWLHRKLEGALELDQVSAERVRTAHGVRGTGLVSHLQVAFHARGVVLDGARLGELVRSGVGPGKAYGCGLLLVRSVS